MKKFFVIALVLIMALGLLAACTPDNGGGGEPPGENNGGDPTPAGPIRVAVIGPHTGQFANFGLGVLQGVQLYVEQLNAAGGINGRQVELVIHDNRGDSTEAINAFNRSVDAGIVGLIGDVLSGNSIAVVGQAYPINMPMITPSSTNPAVTYDAETGTVFTNVFRTCFIDPFQGEKMATFAYEVLGARTAGVLFQTGVAYSVGLKDAFIESFIALGGEILAEEAFAVDDINFMSQLTTIAARDPDVFFIPVYYEDAGLIVTQAREVGITSTILGGDGLSGITGFASAEDLEGLYFTSGFAPGSTPAVIAFEEAFTARFGDDFLNMFAATAFDAAMIMMNAIAIAEESGLPFGSPEYKQAIIDAIRDNSGDLEGVTSHGYTFDRFNNPIKDVVIMRIEGGREVYVQTF